MKFNDIIIIKNWLTPYECSLLNNWASENKNNDNIFKKSVIGENRLTTRFSTDFYFEYPETLSLKFNELWIKLGLNNYTNSNFWNTKIVCTITTNGGELRNHLDPKENGCESLHILTKTSSGGMGGDFFIEDKYYELNEGDCLIFFASILKHNVTKIIGDEDRISWFKSIQFPQNQIED
jgi:hypothetical protein